MPNGVDPIPDEESCGITARTVSDPESITETVPDVLFVTYTLWVAASSATLSRLLIGNGITLTSTLDAAAGSLTPTNAIRSPTVAEAASAAAPVDARLVLRRNILTFYMRIPRYGKRATHPPGGA